jgi:hypothetical protein
VKGIELWTLGTWLAAASAVVCATDALDWLGPQRIGASFREISPHVALACGGGRVRQACTASSPGEVFDGVPVQRFEAMFQDAQFAQGRMIFATTHYAALLRALNARHGPGEDRSFVAIAGMAADFPAGVFIWRSGAVSLVLEQYAGKIDRSSLTYGTHASMAGLMQKARAYPRGARRNL